MIRDTAILAENIQELQILIANEVGKVYDFNINMSKTKLMIVSHQPLMMQFSI
jgi:phosphohistidine phosphatase SixA